MNESILCLRVNPSSWKQQIIDPTEGSIQQPLPWYKFGKLDLKDTLNTAMKAFEEKIEEYTWQHGTFHLCEKKNFRLKEKTWNRDGPLRYTEGLFEQTGVYRPAQSTAQLCWCSWHSDGKFHLLRLTESEQTEREETETLTEDMIWVKMVKPQVKGELWKWLSIKAHWKSILVTY